MARNATRLCIVDLNRGLWSNLTLFDVEEVDIVGGNVNDGESQQGVCNLSMEPLRLVKGKPLELWSKEAHKIPAHR